MATPEGMKLLQEVIDGIEERKRAKRTKEMYARLDKLIERIEAEEEIEVFELEGEIG